MSTAHQNSFVAFATISTYLFASAPSHASVARSEPEHTEGDTYGGVREDEPNTAEEQANDEAARTNEPRVEDNLPPPRPRVEVDSSELNTLSPETIETIAVEAANILAENGFDAHQLQLSLVWIDRMAFTRGVRARFINTDFQITSEDGDPRGPIVSQCTECGEPEYQTVSLEGVLEAIERYHDAQDAAANAKEAPEPEPEPPPSALPPEPAPRGLGPLGGAGITSLSLGGAIMVAGVVLVVFPSQPSTAGASLKDEEEPLFQATSRVDLRPPGYAVLGAGAAVAIVGTVLLVVDRKRSRRGETMAIAPILDPDGGYGIAARGRF